jgi:hypothetical protein
MKKIAAGDKGRVMFFLLRTAFWLTIVLILLPTGQSKPARASSQVGTVEAVTAATAAVADMSQFCNRQPEACVVGSHAAVALGYRAQAGAKMLYEFLTERLGPNETGTVAASLTTKPVQSVGFKNSQQTLTPADLRTPWRGPQPRKDTERRNPA